MGGLPACREIKKPTDGVRGLNFACARDLLLERVFDCCDEFRIGGANGAAEPGDDFAIATDEELLEVPADRAGIARRALGRFEPLIERRLVRAVDVNLLEQVEGHFIFGRAKLLDLLRCARLLTAE